MKPTKTDSEMTLKAAQSDSKVNIVAQELKFAKMLAGNDLKVRNGVLKSLKKWLNTRSQSSFPFTNNDFLRLWKGLYYCMWMSDKPLVQEELADDLASLVHCFSDVKVGVQFYQIFLETMCLEWFGIDQWRIDKFMMLVRRATRQMLMVLKNSEWQEEYIKLFSDALHATIFEINKCPKGLLLHVCDFIIEEISKVSEGDIPEDKLHLILEPFLIYLSKQTDGVILNHIRKAIFYQLLFQSELGQAYSEKFDIWKEARFPTRSLDDIEVKYRVKKTKEFDDEDLSDGQENDEIERSLDPRAGRVNVELMELKFDAIKIAELMENLRYKAFATSKGRKTLAAMAIKFRQFSEDIFPLGIHIMPEIDPSKLDQIDLDLKAIEMAEFEKKLALGDVDSGESDFDDDLDNRKHGKLKRKSKDAISKSKEKKQKLSKLHNSRFLNDNIAEKRQDFTKEDNTLDEDDDTELSVSKALTDMKIKKKKKKPIGLAENEPRKIKIKKDHKRKSLPANMKISSNNGFIESDIGKVDQDVAQVMDKPKKSLKINKESTPSSSKKSTISHQQFEVTDEWSEPLKDGEIEIFIPSRKQKLKELQMKEKNDSTEETNISEENNLVRNPFAKESFDFVKKIKSKMLKGTPKTSSVKNIVASSNSSTKRVVIALNKNKIQSSHEYIKQLKESPSLPFDSTKKPSKGLLKPNAIPSPINPFYKKQIGLKLNFNDTM